MCAAKKAVAVREQELLARFQAEREGNAERMVERPPVMMTQPVIESTAPVIARTASERMGTGLQIIPQHYPYPFHPSPHFVPGAPGPSNWYQRPSTYPPVSNYSNFPPTFYPPVYLPPYVQEGLGNGSNSAERSVLAARNGGMRQEFPPGEYRRGQQDSTGGQGGGR
ncbi:hypothetical protein TREMEDRAFT_64009 [Tremella mesenterica DSM 1558]|uniref:uncharacterized protein n=1 Tax=Tremella mesenterica (strain ATCC 24925 / CBS 8224 / DSM 1558 / NBRC 9311 / NRRL Y-6157 / RJB 2259-6 / UBC 559-6) TaxID=578456 RepID=UPI0003F49E33|nr:uncharacterized protein TREMEDRAFT_64009 [Tremella mesenterica DSM 1558]EIW68115.1 hypothetical protein TREMEDRAFT_64009 [Tremella mesenterica DSM 1558]